MSKRAKRKLCSKLKMMGYSGCIELSERFIDRFGSLYIDKNLDVGYMEDDERGADYFSNRSNCKETSIRKLLNRNSIFKLSELMREV